ncbi:MAG: hypothetical protein IPI67_33170 [Myxococcales bacterium]|nr:hypothetical protein [Myxococcales bacterium]
MSLRAKHAFFISVLAGLSASICGSGCGGGTASPAKSAGQKNGQKSSGETGEGGEQSGSETEAASSPCQDGSCFECGKGLCPKGFYCDEKAGGGPACAWLPECAASATCACVKQVLGSACSCAEKSVGVSVTCE